MRTDDLRIKRIRPLLAPAILLEEIPLTDQAATTVAAGRHEAAWSGLDRTGKQAASGVYFVRLEAGGQRLTQRLTVLR